MNYLKLLLLPLAFVSSCILAHELTYLRQAEVNKKAVAIETQMTRERYVVYSLTSLSIAQNIYPWIALYKSSFSAEVVEPKKMSMIDAIKASCSYLFYTQEGWVSMAQAGFSLGGAMIISKVCDKFVHPDTLRWYVHAYAPYTTTIEMIKERLLALQDDALEQERLIDHQQHLHLLYDRLVSQGESICAYMMYKTKRLDDEEKAIAKRSVRSMFSVQNSWLQRIAVQVESDNFDCQKLERLLSAYHADIQFQLNNFSVIN